MASPDPGAPIELGGDWDATMEAFLAERIYEFNSSTTGLYDGKAIVGAIRDEAQRIIAAVCGHTWGGTCQVTYLWVDEPHRKRGFGRALWREVEAEARRRQCAQVLLSTHSFQAPGFYERLGYALKAVVPDYPRGHAQLVYVKPLVQDDA